MGRHSRELVKVVTSAPFLKQIDSSGLMTPCSENRHKSFVFGALRIYLGGSKVDDLGQYVKIPTPQPPAMPKRRAPSSKQATCKRYCHVLTSASIRWA
jgi:hypothetical protein